MKHALFDPVRAHGAWIYIFVSVAAGSMLGSQRGVEPALLVGTGFVGAYLVTAALVMGVTCKRKQALVGTGLLAAAPLLALAIGADSKFLIPAACAALPALAAVCCARMFGFLSPSAVISGVAALTFAAPTAAMAGGSSPERAALLFGLLFPVFAWRSVRVGNSLSTQASWDSTALRSTGLREAALSALWTLAVLIAL